LVLDLDADYQALLQDAPESALPRREALKLIHGALLLTLAGHFVSVFGAAVTPDGKRVISASADKTLKVWDLETGPYIATFHCE